MKQQKRAFTLNELLIVVAIIILMLLLALPAFNVLSGSKSVEGASNQIGAVLGQARVEAIGVQEVRGVMFFLDPRTARVNVAMVRATPTQPGDTAGVTYLDLVPDRDFTALPTVGIQTIDNAALTGSVRGDDGYIGYNTTVTAVTGTTVTPITSYGGVILFDAYGKLVSTQIGFRCLAVPASGPTTLTAIGSLLTMGDVSAAGNASALKDADVPGATYSSIGLAMYPLEPFNAANYNATDPQISGGSYTTAAPGLPTEQAEETWLDSNSTVYLVNRFNGTLIKGE